MQTLSNQYMINNVPTTVVHMTPSIGQQVLLQDPTAPKLDPSWTGPWKATKPKSPLTVVIQKGSATKVVHVNSLCPLLETLVGDGSDQSWSPPLFIHQMKKIPTLVLQLQLLQLEVDAF